MTLKVERLQPEGMNVRISARQPSYPHLVTVSGTGRIVFIAGQLARDIDSNKATCAPRWSRHSRTLASACKQRARPGQRR
jgi:hypothetical protein